MDKVAVFQNVLDNLTERIYVFDKKIIVYFMLIKQLQLIAGSLTKNLMTQPVINS